MGRAWGRAWASNAPLSGVNWMLIFGHLYRNLLLLVSLNPRAGFKHTEVGVALQWDCTVWGLFHSQSHSCLFQCSTFAFILQLDMRFTAVHRFLYRIWQWLCVPW